MNILQVEPATNFSGGVNQTILNSLELKKRGHRVYLACVKESFVHKRLKEKGFDFIFIDEERSLYSAKLIRNFLKENEVDIVHTHHSKGHRIGLLALMGRRKEKLVVQRGVIFNAKNPLKYLNPRVNLFIANSNVVKNVLMKSFVSKKKIRVIYTAVDESAVYGSSRDEIRNKFGFENRFVFGIVGNYSDWKGQDLLLRAFAGIENRGNALLVFIGKNTELLKEQVEKLGVSEYVKILGFREDAPKLIKGLDCLVIPSIKGESFPNVAVEAFFSKTVVMGTTVGGIPELLENGRGFLCKPEAESLMNTMLAVYHYEDRNKIINRAYEFAKENLTIQKKIDRLEFVYKELLEK